MSVTTVLTDERAGWLRQEKVSGWGLSTWTLHLDGCRYLGEAAVALGPGDVVEDGFVDLDGGGERLQRICRPCARRWAKQRGPTEVDRAAKLFPTRRSGLDPELANFARHWSRRPTA